MLRIDVFRDLQSAEEAGGLSFYYVSTFVCSCSLTLHLGKNSATYMHPFRTSFLYIYVERCRWLPPAVSNACLSPLVLHRDRVLPQSTQSKLQLTPVHHRSERFPPFPRPSLHATQQLPISEVIWGTMVTIKLSVKLLSTLLALIMVQAAAQGEPRTSRATLDLKLGKPRHI